MKLMETMDWLPSYIQCALCSESFADLYLPLFHKSVLRLEEPIVMRGDALVDLFKGKGDALECKNSRGVTVSDSISKKLHGWYRNALHPYFTEYAHYSLCGGRKGRGTNICSFYVQSFIQAWAVPRTSCAVLFVDLSTTFDSVLRPLLFPTVRSDSDLAHFLARFDMPADILHDLYEHSSSPRLEDAGVNKHLQLLISSAHASSWFFDSWL